MLDKSQKKNFSQISLHPLVLAKNGQKMAHIFGPPNFGFLIWDRDFRYQTVTSPRRFGRFGTLGSIFRLSFSSYSRFREGTPPIRQNFGSRNCQKFSALQGSPDENGCNSETKSRKILPKVPKRPERRGLGPYSKKNKFLGQIFFWPFLAIFWPFLARWGQKKRFL